MEIIRVKCRKLLKTIEKKSRAEATLCLFLLAIIPVLYCVDVFHILPHFHQPHSLLYCVHVIPLTFVAFNLLANFVAVVLIDSSVVGRLLVLPEHASKGIYTTNRSGNSRQIRFSERAGRPCIVQTRNDRFVVVFFVDDGTVYCNVCQCAAPPRSWHCDVCDVCILTRDHHCVFSTTCVGHYNRRYFLWFLLYQSVAGFYEIALVGFYVRGNIPIRFSDLTVLVPIYNIVSGVRLTVGQIVIVLLAFSLVAVTMSMLLFIYHFDKVRKGLLCHEKHDKYNFGFNQNLKTVFGEKWYITWISPFVKSELPRNGLDWQKHCNQFKTD